MEQDLLYNYFNTNIQFGLFQNFAFYKLLLWTNMGTRISICDP